MVKRMTGIFLGLFLLANFAWAAEPTEKPPVKEPEKPAPAAPAEQPAAKEPEKSTPAAVKAEVKYPVPDDVTRAKEIPREPRALTLEEAIRIALINNRSLLQSLEGVRAAKAKEMEAVGSFLPRADFVGTYNKNDGDQNPPSASTNISGLTSGVLVSHSETYRGSLQVKQNIFAGGASLFALTQADYGRRIAQEGQRQTAQGTVFSTKQAFYGVLLAQEKVRVAEAAVSQAEEHLRIAKSRFAAGTVSRFDVLRAEVEVANAKPNLIKAKNALKTASENFKKVLGLDLRTEVSLLGDLKFDPITVNMETSLSRALAARPEVMQKSYQQGIEKLNVSTAYARLSPTLDFVANFNRTASSHPQVPRDFENWAYGWNTSFVLTWNLFEGGLTYAKIWGARANLRSSEWARIDQEEVVKVEVKNAIWGLEESQERIESQAKNVEQAQESLRLAQVRYQNGVGTAVEVIDSEVALTQARTNYIEALHDYAVAKANWEKVVGVDY